MAASKKIVLEELKKNLSDTRPAVLKDAVLAGLSQMTSKEVEWWNEVLKKKRNNLDTSLTIRIESSMLRDLNQMAKKRGCSFGYIVRMGIKFALEHEETS